jgi:tRNA(fMet)-specific endonuclease VapC
MDTALFDTDILSEIFKAKNPQVLSKSRLYLSEHRRFAFSEITVYEVVRGLRSKRTATKLSQFLTIINSSDVFPVSRAVLFRAADLWVEALKGGHPKGDADLIIAATALEAGRILVTGNVAHYAWISGLKVTDWRKP